MQVLSKEQQTYIELHADEILREKGISKAQFASAMGVKPQNFNKLVGTKNVVTLAQIGNYLNIPLQVLIFGNDEKELDVHGCIYVNGDPVIVKSKEELLELATTLNKE